MVSVVFWALRETAVAAHEYLTDSDPNNFHCKGCDFDYAGNQVSYIPHIGHVCRGCQEKLAQMFLQ